jgi:hypothetical protein
MMHRVLIGGSRLLRRRRAVALSFHLVHSFCFA